MLRRIGSIFIGCGLIALIGPLFGFTLKQFVDDGFTSGESAFFGIILILLGAFLLWIKSKFENKQPY